MRFDEVTVSVVGEGVGGDDAPVSVFVALGVDVYGDFTVGDCDFEVLIRFELVRIVFGEHPHGDVFGVGVACAGVVVCVYVAAGEDVSGVSGGVEGELCACFLVEGFGELVQFLHLLFTVRRKTHTLHVVDGVAVFVDDTGQDDVVVVQVQGDGGVVARVNVLVCVDELVFVLDVACTNHCCFPFQWVVGGGLECFSQPHINMVPHF